MDERPIVMETASYVFVSVQRYGFEMAVWAVNKADIDAGTASVAKALRIGGTSNNFYQTVYQLQEHSTLGMLVVAGAPDPDATIYGETSVILDWDVGGDSFNTIAIWDYIYLHSFAVMADGADWGVLTGGHFADMGSVRSWTVALIP